MHFKTLEAVSGPGPSSTAGFGITGRGKATTWRRELACCFIWVVTSLATPGVRGQGCVVSRGAGMPACMMGIHLGEQTPPEAGWQASVGYRYLHSDRHFTGSHEDVERQDQGSEVINTSHFIDLGISYAFTPRFSASITFPFSVQDRSQVVRSNDVQRTILQRYSTQSSGLGDMRLMGNLWVLDPHEHMQGNILLGMGVDLPTGQDDVTDTFQAFDAKSKQIVPVERTVDQSIQPGDGGWGLVLDLYAYRQLAPRWIGFVNGSYTITPQEDSGVPTFRSNPFEAVMSIGDSYLGRVGLDYVAWRKFGLVATLAGRIEGVPVHDLVGGSDGFRRPGFAISIEPGISAMIKAWSFSLNLPVALYRNRERSVPDMQQTAATGTYRHGDAAFADFLVIFNVSRHF